MEEPGNVTQLLRRWDGGARAALEELIPLLHHELRRLANHLLQRERDGHTLQSTALVHEAYLRLELRYFGGLSIEEIGTTLATVKRHWPLARAWLYRTMEGDAAVP